MLNLKLYFVQNKEGKFFRAKGYGGYGKTWVDDVQKARIYNRIGPARATITWFANNYPEYGIPDLCEISVYNIQILHDEVERVKKAVAKKKKDKTESELRHAQWDVEEAQKRYEEAKTACNRTELRQAELFLKMKQDPNYTL